MRQNELLNSSASYSLCIFLHEHLTFELHTTIFAVRPHYLNTYICDIFYLPFFLFINFISQSWTFMLIMFDSKIFIITLCMCTLLLSVNGIFCLFKQPLGQQSPGDSGDGSPLMPPVGVASIGHMLQRSLSMPVVGEVSLPHLPGDTDSVGQLSKNSSESKNGYKISILFSLL